MKIARVHIENYRSIKQLDFSPNNYCALIGENNAGKSNILKAINLVLGETWPTDRTFTEEDFNDYNTENDIVIQIYFDSTIDEWRNNCKCEIAGFELRGKAYKTQSENIEISVAADRQMTLKDNVLYDGSNEEYFRFSLLENTTAEDYLKSLSDENAQYNEVETLNGKKTESGFTYRVYYMDVEIRKGQTARHYKFFVTVDETDIILIDAYHYKFKDGSGEEDYLEKYILPVVGSFDIVKN